MADFLSFMVAPLCSQGEHHPGSFVFQHRDQGSTCWIIRSMKIALVVIATVLQVLSFCNAYAHGDHNPSTAASWAGATTKSRSSW